MMIIRASITVASIFVFSASALGQAPARTIQTPSGRVAELVSAQCPRAASQLVDRPELKSILSQRPVDVAAVCTCTQRSFLADARLQAALNVDEQALPERMQNDQMRSYLTMRLMASVLACLTPELERSLAAASLTK
jgi:hypothetical protein